MTGSAMPICAAGFRIFQVSHFEQVDCLQAETWQSLTENQFQLDRYFFNGSNNG